METRGRLKLQPYIFAVGHPHLKHTIKVDPETMECDINQVHFKAYRTSYKHQKRHLLMIKNIVANEVHTYEVDISTLRPHFPELELKDNFSSQSGLEAAETLNKAFGGAKIQRIMNEKKRSSWNPDVMKSINEIKDKSEVQASSLDTSNSFSFSSQDEIRPPYDLNATLFIDAYDMNIVAPTPILSALRDEANKLSRASKHDIEEWKARNTYCLSILNRLLYLPNDPDERLNKACKLALLSCMGEMYMAGSKKVRLTKPFPELNRVLVNDYLLKHFTEESVGTLKRRLFPLHKKEKLLHWYFVLLLNIDDYTCDTTDLSASMKLSSDRISNIFRFLGCQVKTVVNSNGEKALIASLVLPLNFPKENKSLKRKRIST